MFCSKYIKFTSPLLVAGLLLVGILSSSNLIAGPRGYSGVYMDSMKGATSRLSIKRSRTSRFYSRNRSRSRWSFRSDRNLGRPGYRVVRRRCSANDVIFRIQQKYRRRGSRVVGIKRAGRKGFWVTVQNRRGRTRTFFVRC